MGPNVPSIRVELRELLRLAAPIAFAQAGLALMGIVDTAVMGRTGAVPLAAVGLGAALFFAFFCFALGLMLGLDPMISQALGAGDPVRARRLYWLGNWMAVVAGALLCVPLAAVPLLLQPIGIASEIASEAASYLWWRLPAAIPMLWFVASRSYLQALKRTRALVLSTIVANVANLLLDILLVFGGADLPAWLGLGWVPAMGVRGAALASVLCSILQGVIVALAIRRHRLPSPVAELWRGSPADLGTALRVGVPIGLHLVAEVGVFSLAGVLAARIGAESGGAHQVAITLASLTFCVAVGIGSAGSVRVGWAVGAANRVAARRSGFVAIAAGAGFMALPAAVMLLAPRSVVTLITHDPAVIATAVPLMVVAAAFQLSDGVQGVAAGVLRGAGDSRFTFIANVLGHYGIGLPVALWLATRADMGVTGLWWGLCAGLTAVAVALLARFSWLSSRPIRRLSESDPAAPPRLLGEASGA